MRTSLLIIVFVLCVGCQQPSRILAPVKQPLSTKPNLPHPWTGQCLDEIRAIIIAQDAVAKNDTWADGATFSARRNGSGWSVLARHIESYDDSGKPRFAIGGHRLIAIDENGKVRTYGRGM
jgi:hypothetical protein